MQEAATHRAGSREWLYWHLFCCLCVSVPILVVAFPPITDLPQHVAQVRLLTEALSNESSPYEVQWLTPYDLVYVLFGCGWWLFSPQASGIVGTVLLGLFWVSSLFYYGRRVAPTPLSTALAATFFFSHLLYWGFFAFILGWGVFFIWLRVLDTPAW
jgi:hypothetical protein